VINQTEALVAIDVNSGKATRERNIEATALKTNVEAAEEAARQLRLRDLAGLIVIDFIDMDEAKNNRTVEKVLKDALKDDRARIQMGKISGFGLMEISRQRRRTGVLEGTTHVCEHCDGTGRVRSVESSALAALRAVEVEALKGGGAVTLKVSRPVGIYILNEKRAYLLRLQQTHALFVTVLIDDSLHQAEHDIDRTELGERPAPQIFAPIEPEPDYDDEAFEDEEDEDEEEIIAEDEDESDDEETSRAARPARGEASDEEGGRRGRKRRRRGGRRDERDEGQADAAGDDEDDVDGGERAEGDIDGEDEESRRRRRRRGRRGGRRGGREDGDRPADAFAWTRPRVPFGENAFVWHDPAELDGRSARPERAERPDRSERAEAPVAERAERPERAERGERGGRRGRGRGERAERTEASDAPRAERAPAPRVDVAELDVAPLPPPVIEGPPTDVWVELPPQEEAPKKARRPRGRGRKAEAAEAAPEAVVEAPAPEAVEEAPVVAADVEVAAPVVAEAAPQPIVEPEAVPVAVEPDPAEISTPPEKPKRGWWRRG